MAVGPSVALLRDMRMLFDAGTVAGLSDRELLERFMDARDGSSAAAFEVLVRRHGPMVLRVCRNVLKDWNDAEDAFQATFVVLARRCGSIRRRDSVESWLFGVACRVASRARVEAARRKAIERRGAAEVETALGPPREDDADLPELGPILQEEVERLPEKYRSAVVLCYWEALTQEQAAAQLGVPLGTVRSRIARARDLLRKRLTRRGVAPLAGISASSLEIGPVAPIPAAVPDSWVAATTQAVSPLVSSTGPARAAATSAAVSALVQDVLRRMWIMKLKMTATCLLLVATGAAGVILAAPQQGEAVRPARRPAREARDMPPPTAAKAQPPLKSLGEYTIEPPDVLVVEVLEALPGRPISGARLVRPDGKISLGFYGEVYVAGLNPMEAKEKIVLHLRKFLNDDILGLTDSGEVKEIEGPIPASKLRATDRVFVDVTSYNSKNYYVQGAVHSPGRFPVTGHETVLDAINFAGGLSLYADRSAVVLYRKEKDGTLKKLPIDVAEVTMGENPTTNYQLLPGDRLVVPGRRGRGEDAPLAVRSTSSAADSPSATAHEPEDPRRPESPATIRQLERRLDQVERKLDRILDALERSDTSPKR